MARSAHSSCVGQTSQTVPAADAYPYGLGTTLPRSLPRAVLWLSMTAVTPGRLDNALVETQRCYV